MQRPGGAKRERETETEREREREALLLVAVPLGCASSVASGENDGGRQ